MLRLIEARLATALARWVALVGRHPHAVLLGVMLLSLLAATASWRHAGIDGDLERLIRPGPEQAWYRHDQDFKAAFPDLQQTAVVVVSGDDRSAVVSHARRLERALREDPAFAQVLAPDLHPFFETHALYYLPPDRLQTWLTAIAFDPSSLDRLLARGPGTTPQDTHYVSILLQGASGGGGSLPHGELVDHLRTTVATPSPAEGVQVRLTGEIVLEDEEITMALTGIGMAGSVSLLLLALILGFGVRCWRIALAIFTLLACGTALTLGWATLAIGEFNTLALIFVVMFFGLGVDFAVHFGLRVRDTDVVEAASSIGPALLLCMLTSSMAFLAFAPTAYRGLAELGVISAGGMVVAFILTLTLMPALFALTGPPRPSTSPRRAPRAARLPARPVVAAALILALAAGWIAKDLRFDFSVLALRDAGTEAMATLLELQDAQQTTDYSIAVLAHPEDVASLRASLQALPEVGRVTAPENWVPENQDRIHAELQQAAAAFDGLDRPDLEPLQRLLGAQPFDLDDLPDAVRRLSIGQDGRHLLRVEPVTRLTDRAAMTAFIEAVAAVAPNHAGRAVVEWGVGNVVVKAFTEAAMLAFAGIAVLLLLHFRSPLWPILVLLPITLALLLTFAIAELTDLTLNMANILVVPLIFGLGVDTGIHVVHRFRNTGSVDGVYRSSTARAVIISGLTTIGTFIALAASPHKGAASVGLLLAVAIGTMLAVTFVLLPALLRLLPQSRSRGPPGSSIPPG